MIYPPREGDLPREELVQQAQRTIDDYVEHGVKVSIFFKFTCENCGTRCTLSEANNLYEEGECFVCGHKTPIRQGGFMLELEL